MCAEKRSWLGFIYNLVYATNTPEVYPFMTIIGPRLDNRPN